MLQLKHTALRRLRSKCVHHHPCYTLTWWRASRGKYLMIFTCKYDRKCWLACVQQVKDSEIKLVLLYPSDPWHTIHRYFGFHLTPRLTMSTAIPLLPPYAFLARRQTTSPFYHSVIYQQISKFNRNTCTCVPEYNNTPDFITTAFGKREMGSEVTAA